MGTSTSKYLDVDRHAADGKESNIMYCGMLPIPTSVPYYSAAKPVLEWA